MPRGIYDRKSAEELFWTHVVKTDGCWFWTAHTNRGGYGVSGGTTAHRVAYRLVKGDIRKGMSIDHLCRNHRCVNPDHLDAVTQRENVYRGLAGRIPLYCKHGHYRTAATLRVTSSGGQACRVCDRLRATEANRAKRQAAQAA